LIRSVAIGFRAGGSDVDQGAVRWESTHERDVVARREDEALFLTGDGQMAEVAATAQYRLDAKPNSLQGYAFGTSDGDAAIRPLAEAAVRAVVSRLSLDDLLTNGRRDAERKAASLLQSSVDAYGLGLHVEGVSLLDVHPPLAVVDAYRDVVRAESEQRRRTNEGRTYAAERLARANGLAAATGNRAEAERISRIVRAAADSEAFLRRVDARASSPLVTDARAYWDTMESSLAGKSKIVVDPASSTRRHLILPEYPAGTAAASAVLPDTRPTTSPAR
jgi:regulator of protease activity HflC (stomatin/prohibitin superfamily)